MIKSQMTTNASFVGMLESADKYLLDNVPEKISPHKDYIAVDDVRIYPASISFSNAYDGKKFKNKIEIINSGKKIAFVRILNPTTKVFKIKAVPKGRYLSAGMSIIRFISHTFSTAMPIRKAMIPIYINEKHFLYNIEVSLSLPLVTLNPRVINFGDIDLGDASEQLSIFLTNSGHKIAQYLVDLGRNDLEIIVEPMKGTIQPGQSAEVKFELLGTRETSFNKEFWIKTSPIQRFRIMGTFITPKLEITHPSDTKYSVTLVQFPKTYYGAESSKILVIKNSSSKPTMFCTVAEFKGQIFEFEKARKINDTMKFFALKPKEGRLTAKHEYVLTAYYIPKKRKPVNANYHICFIRVNKVPFRAGIVEEKEMEVKTFSSNLDLDVYTVGSSITLDQKPLDLKTLENVYVRVCLYGETEQASVRLTPDAFKSNDLVVNEIYHYTFNIKNKSKELPITYHYNKIPFVEMKPSEMSLEPDRSMDVLLIITPKIMGVMEKKIVISLLFTNKDDGKTYNVGTTYFRISFDVKLAVNKLVPKFVKGITPMCTNEVGYLVDNVRFNSEIEKPIMAIVDPNHSNFHKDNNALIAFPNDRRRSLRPHRGDTPTKTIFTQIPRYVNKDDEYWMRSSGAERKNLTRSFYSKYIRKSGDHHQVPKTELNEYEISGKSNLLKYSNVDENCLKDEKRLYQLQEKRSYHFIPLNPEKLMKIIIKPKYIALGKIAPFTSCTDSFSIENRNDFAVIISIKALCNSILIKGNKRIVINQHEIKNIYFDCFSFGLGKYYVPVYIIVNDSHIFDATVFAEVVPRTLKCRQNEVLLNSDDTITTIVVHNPVNCNVGFRWEVQDENVIVTPKSGHIPPRRNILCKIKSVPFVGDVLKTDIYLISESGAKQIIRVICQNDKINLLYDAASISFENIPLNVAVTKFLVVRNPSEMNVILRVLNPNPMEGITVTPQQIVMKSTTNAFFKITVHFQAVMDFKCKIRLCQQNVYQQEIDITGNVAYPNVEFSPSSIQFAKVPSWTFQKAMIVVKNTGVTRNTIEVDLSYYPGLSLSNTDLDPIKGKLTLEPKESMSLYFLFQPSEPAVYSLFLPCVLNGIIGPPQLNNPKTLKSAMYYKYDSASSALDLLPEVINNNLPVVRARCTSGAPWILFSTLKIHFNYHKQTETKEFKITNVHTNECSVVLGKRHFIEEFTIGIEDSDKDYKECESYYKVSLKPQEAVTFLIEFHPKAFGEFRVAVPILVDIFSLEKPFNFLFLSGSYPKHEIESTTKVLCFQNVPVKMKASTRVHLKYRNHYEDCKFKIKNDYSCLNVKLIRKTSISRYEYSVEFKIQFIPTEELNYSIKLEFSCTCECYFHLYLKASANNSSLFRFNYPFTSPTTSMSGRPFPYVLQGVRIPNCDISIDNMIDGLEIWMFTQCFFYQNRYLIPDSISRYPFEIYCPEKKDNTLLRNKKKRNVHLPIVHLIINIIDRSVEKHLTDGNSLEPNLDDVKGTQADYTTYKNVLTFLSSQDVFIDHIRPEFLLTYERYLIFKEKLNDSDYPEIPETLDENNFNIFSKVLWAELILRIYKRFSVDRILSSKGHLMNCPLQDEFEVFWSSKLASKSEDCTENEFRLLKWVEFHYAKGKTILLTEEHGKLREFNSFDAKTDLMKDVYPAPNHISQELHNSFILRKVVNSLGLSIRCKHLDDKRTDFHRIMILTYLYGVLPCFYPSQDLEIKAKLGETGCCEISVKHFEPVTVGYIATFFGNELEEFEVSDRTIIISPKQTKTIKIKYSTKEGKKAKAVLVLSGEKAGQRFAKSKVYNIHGIPDITYCTDEFFFRIPLYQVTSHVLRVTSPCNKNYVAKTHVYVCFAKDLPDSLSDKIVSVSEVNEMCLPRQINIEDSCVFDKDGRGIIKLETCLVVNTPRSFYLYFMNKEAGIFCVKIVIKCIADDRITETINVSLASNFDPTEKCICKTDILNIMCPLVFSVEIPSRNNLLLKALRDMLVIFADEEEIRFWNQHLVFPKGMHLLRAYLENTFPPKFNTFRDVLFQTVKYNTVSDTKLYKAERSLIIEDVTSESFHKLAIHWLSGKFPTDHNLTLQADHGLEIRKYKLKFISKKVSVKNEQ